MTSPDLTARHLAKIAELFPGVITEAVNAEGNPVSAVDFDLLRQELSDHVVEGPQERYQLDWPGKRAAAFAANAPIAKTLRPIREQSVDFDTTKNLFIEGDNLDALKLLQESYLGKVKIIYIDPPYNTGNDFIYRDNFAESTDEYLTRSHQRDEGGSGLVTNLESNGRFHSDWLSMMYSRLRLARNLLRPDGMLFVSIDDNEQHNMRKLCDEVFGEENFVNCVAVKLSEATGVKMSHAGSRLPKTKEYVLFYRRTPGIRINRVLVPNESWNNEYKEILLGLDRETIQKVKELLEDEEATGAEVAALNKLVADAEVTSLTTHLKKAGITSASEIDAFKWENSWRIIQAVGAGSLRDRAIDARRGGQALSAVASARGKLSLFKTDFDDSSRDPRIRILFADDYLQHNPGDFWSDIKTAGGVALEGGVPFPNGKKPLKLLRRLVHLGTDVGGDDIVMDFFAGSGTTGQAVLEANLADGGKRQFILVQLDEEVDLGSEASRAGIKTISELSSKRLRNAGSAVLQQVTDGSMPDVGFRYMRVDSSNMADVLRVPDETEQQALASLEDSVREGRSGEDLLFQVLLDWGLELSMPISVEQVDEHEMFVVEGGALIACFDTSVSTELIRTLAKREPLRVVFRDAGFESDDARINAEQVFREFSPATDVKVI
ncbi:site-specific DNA-methyltransferase [Ornithinimicrobium sp. W1679]|uniref:site-specific DNA-methyltransferase n=1 Tax=Ornithinimicrobium sp. W1679 TaxID=3418770 RepID=UPI003CF7A1A0